jgi:von Willebrand factor type A domain
VRRALIAAIEIVRKRNASIRNINQRDWVSIVTFDSLTSGGPFIDQPLTGDYDAAMLACTKLQAVGDKGSSTATESGLIKARQHLKPVVEGGAGREDTNKVFVLLTDGVPNLYSSKPSDISNYIGAHSSPDFYNNGAWWYDAPLMQTMKLKLEGALAYPVGVGLGTDYDFMDRLARLGGTANDDGESPRGSGNPAEYEERLAEIFEEIITSPLARLVQ